MEHPSNIERLMQLGFTLDEAKVFLALSEIGTATVKVIADARTTKRGTSKILRVLCKKGVVEEVSTSPKRFRAIPLEDAYEKLIQNKEKITIKGSEAFPLNQKTVSQNIEEIQILTLPSGKIARGKIRQEHDNAKKTIDVIIPFEKFFKIADLMEKKSEKFPKSKVKMRIITEKQAHPKIEKYPNILSKISLLESRRVNFGYVPNFSSVEMIIFDKKKLMLAASPGEKIEKMTWIQSNNPVIVEMGSNYFESLWETTTKHENTTLCRAESRI